MLHVDERAEIHLEGARARGPEVDSRGPLSAKGGRVGEGSTHS